MAKEEVSSDATTEINYYDLLGVTKTSTEAEIKSAYRKLALKYHPDRIKGGDADAAEHFKLIATAYAVLTDPNTRRQYDLLGDSSVMGKAHEFQSVDVEAMGGMSRMFGAMMTKLGMPIPTQISQSILTTARELANGQTLTHRAVVVKPFIWGHEFQARVDKQDAHFYKLCVTPEDVERGVVITCRSPTKSKFKLVLFDSSGAVRLQQESVLKRAKYTAADIFFTPFEVMRMQDPWINLVESDVDDLPAIFNKLSMLEPCHYKLEPGDHMFAVYGDNWLQQVRYTLKAIVAEHEGDSSKVIQRIEQDLLKKKMALDQFQKEFVEAKKQFLRVMQQVEDETKYVEEALLQRDDAYDAFIQVSSEKYVGNVAFSTASERESTLEGGKSNSGGIIGSEASSNANAPGASGFNMSSIFSGFSSKFRKDDTTSKQNRRVI